jgi:L-amino acid N-acyltransferase YncA
MASMRAATESDLPGILAIYNEVIASSTAVYSLEPTTLDEGGLGSRRDPRGDFLS